MTTLEEYKKIDADIVEQLTNVWKTERELKEQWEYVKMKIAELKIEGRKK